MFATRPRRSAEPASRAERLDRAGQLLLLAVALGCSFVFAQTSHDVVEYGAYARAALTPPLLHHWPTEYPPLALLTFLPAAGGPLPFALAVAAATVVLWWALGRETRRGAAFWAALLALAGIGTLAGRYDIFPTLACTLGVLAARRRRWSAAWAWLALATALKLYAAGLWPLLLIAEVRATGHVRWERPAAALAGCALTVAAAAATGGSAHAVSALAWLMRRPIEVESLAAPLMLAQPGGHVAFSFGSLNTLGAHAGLVGAALGALLALAEIGVCRALWRGRLNLTRAAAAALTWEVLLSKVLSAQYLLWLLPLWALAAWGEGGAARRPAGAASRWWMYAAAALTAAVFPFGFLLAGPVDPWVVVGGATARNVCLLAVAANLSGWSPLLPRRLWNVPGRRAAWRAPAVQPPGSG